MRRMSVNPFDNNVYKKLELDSKGNVDLSNLEDGNYVIDNIELGATITGIKGLPILQHTDEYNKSLNNIIQLYDYFSYRLNLIDIDSPTDISISIRNGIYIFLFQLG